MRAVEKAEELMRCPSIVFFEVTVGDDEDIVAAAKEISELGCSVVVDCARSTVRCFCPDTMPKGFGFL